MEISGEGSRSGTSGHTITVPSSFICLVSTCSWMGTVCYTGPGAGEAGAQWGYLPSGSRQGDRAGGLQHASAHHVPHTSGFVLLEVLTGPLAWGRFCRCLQNDLPREGKVTFSPMSGRNLALAGWGAPRSH